MPSDIVDLTLILVGGYRGKTVILGGQQFTDGKLRLQGERQALAGLIMYLGKAYQAFPRDSEQFKNMQKICGEEEYGTSKDIGSVQETGKPTESGVRQDGSESAPVHDLLGEANDGDNGGTERGVSNGDGHENTGLHREETDGRDNENEVIHPPAPFLNAKLTQVVMALDHNNDKHWTEAGLPAMAAIEQAMESTGILRSEVEAAAPDHNREEAAKFSTSDL